MDVVDTMPLDASGGGDFLTGLPQREIIERTPGGGTDVRRERIVICGRTFNYGDPPTPVGRVVLTELTVRALAAAIGYVPESVLSEERERAAKAEDAHAEASMRLAAALREVEALRDSTDPRIVYVAPDGTEHGSKPALERHLDKVQA